jgi:quinol monooxygenase YgiN
MDQKKLTVVARMKARAGKEEEVKKELFGLIGPTRSEPGCINYDLHQALDDPSVFMFYENWRSKGDLDNHMETQHFRTWVEKAEGLLDGPSEVTLWQMIGQRLVE